MAQEELMGAAMGLATSLEALAAVAAHLRVELEGLDVEPRTRQLLQAITTEVAGTAEADGPLAGSVIGLVRMLLAQSVDLVGDPSRPPGWTHLDEPILEGAGRLSRAVVAAVKTAEGELAGLAARLAEPGSTFLDVGTGTGWLAIALAEAYSTLHVVGVDIFEPALYRARRNVAASAVSDRIELRLQDVLSLDERGAYDAIWLPLPFLPESVTRGAIAVAARALRPGGWLLPGTFGAPPDHLSQLVCDLRIVRSGGYVWGRDELVAELGRHGLEHARELEPTWIAPVRLFGAQRPDA